MLPNDTLIHTPCDPLHTHCWYRRPHGDNSYPGGVHTHSPHVDVSHSNSRRTHHRGRRLHPQPHKRRSSETPSSVHTSAHTCEASPGGIAPLRTRRPARSPPPHTQPPLSCRWLPLGHLLLTPHCRHPPPHRGWGHGGGGLQTHGAEDTHMCPPCGRS